MAGEWRTSTWGDEISLEYGKSLRSHGDGQGQFRVFGSNGPIGWTDEPLATGPGVILGRKGANRGVEYSPDDFFVIDTAYYVVPKTDLDMRWLYYAIQHYKLGEIDDGSPIPSTTRAAVYVRTLEVPSAAEQRAIANILGTLDDKIELNRRMKETLESVTRALFKSWFVDFDPVRAKMEGCWRADEALPGLPAELYEPFPDRFVEAELGEVPEGWEVEPLDDLVEAKRGLSYKGKYLADDGVPMHNLNSILEGGGYKYDGIKFYTGEYRDRHRVSPGDLVVANTEQGHDRLLIGYATVIPDHFGPEGIFSHHLYRVTPRGDSHVNAIFLCYLLNSGPMQQVVSGFANGTTVNMLPPDALQLPRLVVPPEPLVARFTEIAESIQRRKEELVSESKLLAELRDTVLPRLISGELRITNVDRFAEVDLQ